MERTLISVYYVDDSVWLGNGCDCCEDTYFEALTFSHIEGVSNPEQYQSYDYEIYNGSKGSEFDCLVSVFWDLVADQSKYEDFYDMCASFYDIGDLEIRSMLLDKGIEVIFLED